VRFIENKPGWDLVREDAAFEESFANVLAAETYPMHEPRLAAAT
jgi:hypothetical protein